MRTRTLHAAMLLACGAAGTVLGQQGHPLTGSWHGVWGPPGGSDPMDLTVIMDWDGTAVTGLVNPLTDRARFRNAELDSSDWSVRFEVDVRNTSGQTVSCVADGRLDRLGSDRRTLAGAWSCEGVQAEFHLTRDRDY